MQSESLTDRFAHYFHWLYFIVPLVSLAVAAFLKVNKEWVEFVLIPGLVLVNLIIVWLRTCRNARKELTPIRSFFSDSLRPSRSSEELRFNTEVVVIGDGTTETAFCDELDKTFKQILDPTDQPRLKFQPITFTSPLEKIRNVATELQSAKSVVVIRTEKLESPDAVYQAVNAWAFANSEVPVLFTPLVDKLHTDAIRSKIPEKFRRIPKDAKTLPWRLLQRAGERASVWRQQASFNGLIAANVLAFLIVGITFAYYMLHLERVESYNALKETHHALDTKSEYENLAKMSGVDVSYWFRYGKEPHVYVTTELEPQPASFVADKTSIVGCAFEKPNRHAHWDMNEAQYVTLWDFSDHSQQTNECGMTERPNKPISSILCTSYNPWSDESLTVGICVFAGDGRHLVVTKETLDLLERRSENFFGRTYPDSYRHLTPLVKRFP